MERPNAGTSNNNNSSSKAAPMDWVVVNPNTVNHPWDPWVVCRPVVLLWHQRPPATVVPKKALPAKMANRRYPSRTDSKWKWKSLVVDPRNNDLPKHRVDKKYNLWTRFYACSLCIRIQCLSDNIPKKNETWNSQILLFLFSSPVVCRALFDSKSSIRIVILTTGTQKYCHLFCLAALAQIIFRLHPLPWP